MDLAELEEPGVGMREGQERCWVLGVGRVGAAVHCPLSLPTPIALRSDGVQSLSHLTCAHPLQLGF